MLRLLGGLIVWVSTLYCGPAARTGKKRGPEGSGLYPELAVLGFSEGSSPALASKIGRLTALLPSYEVARRELADEGLSLNGKEVYRIANQLGAEILTARTRDLESYRAGKLAAGTELKGKRVGAAIDGGRVRTRVKIKKKRVRGQRKKRRCRYRCEWREPKVLIIFELDEQGRMKRKTRPWIDSTFRGPDECMELLAMHLHRLGAAAAELVVFLADGAPWIWERVAWVQQRVGLSSEQVAEVLDCCHAVHHISLALEALTLPAAERQKHYRQLRQWLRAGRAYDVMVALSRLAEQQGKSLEEDVWTHIAFLEKHTDAQRTRYATFRRRGIPLGSGAIESAVRRVINLRLKGNGITWYEENAEAMAAMRAAALTDRWEETLKRVRQRMAPDRRLEWQWESPDLREELKSNATAGAQLPQTPASQQVQQPAA